MKKNLVSCAESEYISIGAKKRTREKKRLKEEIIELHIQG